ncbi:TPA: hypothetical protein ACOQ31_005058 [Bacillus cereus]|uniref:hypothetical protein n=1 Tax=Bacillus cereus TaxID=1396 RepID=UPI0019296E80|nr:hypothetical protein [Bacillus cereus]MBL3768549.1 hypothetical protein [Bacillus cereus]HDR8205145.1 hypothetical protein [Bacillus cereus]HDR8211066.1 hypothetical protein [Bacillus cereus]HDR8225213.1 hypothetical protein [Bacillus cereus]HDR8237703.1 hypothetical protein [Bacillus cereus]
MIGDKMQGIINYYTSQETLEILFLSIFMYACYLLILVIYNYRYVQMEPAINAFVIPMSLPIFLISWLIYDKLPQSYSLFVEMHNSMITYVSIPLIGIGIFNLVYVSYYWIVYRIEKIDNYKRRKRIEFTKTEKEIFSFSLDRFLSYKETYLDNNSSLVVEGTEALYKSLLSLHILNPKDICECFSLRNYEWLLLSYPEKHPVKKYYSQFEDFPLFVQEGMEESGRFRYMNEFIRSSIREFKLNQENRKL